MRHGKSRWSLPCPLSRSGQSASRSRGQSYRQTWTRTSGIPAHEEFWTLLFRHTEDVAVVTTNYDVVAERESANTPRPRRHRPGFHYGFGAEQLWKWSGVVQPYSPNHGCWPNSLLKLHGSVSWSISNRVIGHYFDCRPAIQGRALIIAPVTEKSVPQYLQPIWDKAADALSRSQTWLVIGYSFPTYDKTVNVLLAKNAGHWPAVHVFNPDATVAKRVKATSSWFPGGSQPSWFARGHEPAIKHLIGG